MVFVRKQSLLHNSASICAVLLVLLVAVNAGKPELKGRPMATNLKVDTQTCDKVLPVVSRQQSKREDRIVNGDDAPNMKSYMAGLAYSEGIFCSATLLSEYWVLTAAHCDIDISREFVRVGAANENEGTDIEIEETFTHPDYFEDDSSALQNDVQLVKLKSAVPKDSKFFVLNTDDSYPAPFSFTRTSGYGRSLDTSSPDSGVLREVDVPVVGTKRCKRQYDGIFTIRQRNHICAGYDEGGCDSCQGDSGGPLYTFTEDRRLVQVGVVSFGFNCAEARKPGVYARVSKYIDWMKSVGAEFQTTSDGINVFSADDVPLTPTVTPTATPTSTPTSTPTVTPATPETPTPSSTATPSAVAQVSFFEQLINCFTRNLFITTAAGKQKRITDLSAGERVRFGKRGQPKLFQFQGEDDGVLKFLQLECEVCEALILPFCG
eukprot:TRINITY_DN54_c2_g1_i1.p1 TRINITY_DN54_c2_g1~~TRINITY_DN54_c2_g1_i1.p1  ORF type:complete len:434 (+),score=69.99 TRINITY_DN54_c2_g1_i1:294-1595(+)